jgi:UDP-N-acetylmuramate dehydrogenase
MTGQDFGNERDDERQFDDQSGTPTLASLTTMRVGGRPHQLIAVSSEQELIDTAKRVWASGEHWLLLGGGSNTIAADEAFDGTVIQILTRGIDRVQSSGERAGEVVLRIQAGEPWDSVVATAVRNGWSGIEALSGIPGSAGAAPVQNIGAYGQEVSDTLVAIDFLDYASGELRRIPAAELGLGYRTSALKRGLTGVVTAVELRLTEDVTVGAALSAPIAYAQLADALGVALGTRVSLAELRRTVIGLRASKGMVLDPDDPDSVSAGSFFTNPIVSEEFSRTLPDDAPRWPVEDEEPDLVATLDASTADHSASVAMIDVAARERSERQSRAERSVKLSAAWLIERAGIHKGFALPGSHAAISSKHTLAIVNRGGADAYEVVQLASFVQLRVHAEFGVILRPEPVLVDLAV